MTNISLTALAREQLELAAAAPSGRSGHSVVGGVDHRLRQVMIALTAGHTLQPHPNPGDATVQVLVGRARVVADGTAFDGAAGHLIVVPDATHTLEALEDTVVLLTVVNHG